MGYTITIGNAVPEHSKEDGELSARYVVQSARSDEAPTFPNDELTGNSNNRSPSYTAWHEFCRETGLEYLFYNNSTGLLRQHPGCFLLQPYHLAAVYSALTRWQNTATKPPGFAGIKIGEDGHITYPDEGKYDHQLARLLWLEWWMRWALAHCETPAIQNT